MGMTDRVVGFVRRATPYLGLVGGLLFFAYWFVRAREVALPTGVGALLDISTVVLLGTAVLGYQLAQGLAPGAWVGWAGVAAVLEGLVSSPPSVCLGLVLLGVSIARCEVHPRVPGIIMAVSAMALFLSYFTSAGFGRGYGEVGLLAKGVMGLALIGVAASLADLLVLERGAAQHANT
jgi:hypothetical protein